MAQQLPLPQALSLAALLLTCACGQQGGGTPPAALVFGMALTSLSGPQPAALLIATPGANLTGTWKTEVLKAPSEPLTLAIGRSADGRLVQADLDLEGQLTGEPFNWGREAGKWVRRSVAGLTLEQVDFKNSEGQIDTFGYDIAHGNVVHKALWFTPQNGAAGILTISGNMGSLDIWHLDAGAWRPTTLWAEPVGTKTHRLRDMELADVDGDKQIEIVIATHDQGSVYVIEETPEGFVGQRIAFHPEMAFVHEIEVGDVDGDGKAEIFATPSEPNRLDGNHQKGEIHRYDHEADGYRLTVVENNPTTHAKEILCTDLEGDGQLELYSVMEGEALKDLNASSGDNPGTHIKRYNFSATGVTTEELVDLPGNLCRFLVSADLQGDGDKELIASTMSDGIFSVAPVNGKWESKRLLGGLASGGFEHATLAFDWDGDGADELYVASDEFKRLNRVAFDQKLGRVTKTVMADLSSLGNYMCWNLSVLPQGYDAR